MTLFSLAALLGLAGPSPATAGIFRHKDVQSIEIFLDAGEARAGEAIPDSEIPLSVRLTDGRGNVRTTTGARPGHIWRKLRVEVDGGSWDPSRAVIIVDPAHARSVEDLKTGALGVQVRSTRTRGARDRETLALDWRAVHGPPPEEISAVRVYAKGKELLDEKWLLPGSVARLHVEIDDLDGRTHSTADTLVRLPWDRIELTVDGLQDRGSGRLFAARTRAETPYRATVAIQDTTLEPVAMAFVRDWERIDGPHPKAIAHLTATVQPSASSPRGTLAPGASTPVTVSATTKEGRTFTTTPGAQLSLPVERLRVRTTFGTWNPNARDIRWSSNLRAIVGHEFAAEFSYQDRPDTAVMVRFLPDLLAPLKPWLTHEPVHLIGDAGRAGRSGRPGAAGQAAAAADGSARGMQGGEGEAGEAGEAGGRGPTLRITAWTTTTLDRKHPVVVYVLDGPSGRSVHVLRPDDGPLHITSQGGAGGAGGEGGTGGTGGIGSSTCIGGVGGLGGTGGMGGSGGAGGTGGRILLRVDHSGTARAFDLSSEPGESGMGGRGGDGGRAGTGGSGVETTAIVAGETDTCTRGSDGAPGADGTPGRRGAMGTRGSVRVVVDRGAVAVEASALPPRLAEALP
ncbi:MAG: hypothetical protein CL927_13175 [Deltaproteobacteria bacterium]|nr:hypothetical protein [Deltaproteobacteria bacterium]HCH63585.1 hypothetical protein [Deltaproteobacteria bacterium]